MKKTILFLSLLSWGAVLRAQPQDTNYIWQPDVVCGQEIPPVSHAPGPGKPLDIFVWNIPDLDCGSSVTIWVSVGTVMVPDAVAVQEFRSDTGWVTIAWLGWMGGQGAWWLIDPSATQPNPSQANRGKLVVLGFEVILHEMSSTQGGKGILGATTTPAGTAWRVLGFNNPDKHTIWNLVIHCPIECCVAGSANDPCTGDNLVLSAETNAMATYWYDPMGSLVGTGNIAVIQNVEPDDSGYYVVKAVTEECIDTDTVLVEIIDPVGINVSPEDTTVCYGEAVTLSVTGATDPFWSNGYDTDLISVVVTSDQVVTVEATDTVGCLVSDTSHLWLDRFASISGDTTICINGTTTLVASSGVGYEWSTGDTASNIEVSPSETTTYYVTVTDDRGCIDHVSTTVTISDLADIGNDTTVCAESNVILRTPDVAVDYQWSHGDQFPSTLVHVGTEPVEVSVTVTDEIGCVSSDTMTVFPDLCCPEFIETLVYLPNIFSPNGDGINEIWCPMIGESFFAHAQKIESVQIFDRWGGIRFEVNAGCPSISEQGTNMCWNGDGVVPGVYVIKMIVRCQSGQRLLIARDVTVLPGAERRP